MAAPPRGPSRRLYRGNLGLVRAQLACCCCKLRFALFSAGVFVFFPTLPLRSANFVPLVRGRPASSSHSQRLADHYL